MTVINSLIKLTKGKANLIGEGFSTVAILTFGAG